MSAVLDGGFITGDAGLDNDHPEDLIFDNIDDDGLTPNDNGDDLATKFAALEANYTKLEQQHKSLQGQYKGAHPIELQAQLDELQKIVFEQQVNKQATPPTRQLPSVPKGLQDLFGESSDEFAQFIDSIVAPQQATIQSLQSQIADMSKRQAMAPLDALRASDTDGVFSDEGFDSYLKNDKDDLGLSRYDKIKATAGANAIVTAQLMQKAKANWLKSKATDTADSSQAPTQMSHQRRVSSAPQAATPRTASQGGNEQQAERMKSEYRKLQLLPASKETVAQRMALRSQAALRGIDLNT